MTEYNLDQALELVKKSKITSFIIENLNVKVFENCKINLSLKDEYGNINGISVELTNEEYANWNNDDNYIINLIKTKLTQILS